MENKPWNLLKFIKCHILQCGPTCMSGLLSVETKAFANRDITEVKNLD